MTNIYLIKHHFNYMNKQQLDKYYSDPPTQEDIDFAEQCERDKWEEYNRDKGV